ncbi:MAG: sigma-70 family RNA polymerase sigma factor [Planctomycetota bacterium]
MMAEDRAMKDSQIIDECRRGNWQSFEVLVKKYEERVFHFAWKLTGSEAQAKDVTQEAFIKVFKHLMGFRGRSAFSTWLYRIVYNLSMDELRFLQKKERELEGMGERVMTARRSFTPADAALTEEMKQKINEAVDGLPPHYRSVLILSDYEGLPYGEISEILGCKRGTVKSRLHTSRAMVRKELSGYFGDRPQTEDVDHEKEESVRRDS